MRVTDVTGYKISTLCDDCAHVLPDLTLCDHHDPGERGIYVSIGSHRLHPYLGILKTDVNQR